jgi:hypothetical protein
MIKFREDGKNIHSRNYRRGSRLNNPSRDLLGFEWTWEVNERTVIREQNKHKNVTWRKWLTGCLEHGTMTDRLIN